MPDILAALDSLRSARWYSGQVSHIEPLPSRAPEYAKPGDPLIACIGPITALAAREAGFENCLVAQEYTTAGLIALLRSCETR